MSNKRNSFVCNSFINWFSSFTNEPSYRSRMLKRTPVAAGLESLEDRILLTVANGKRARNDIVNIAADANPNFVRGNVLTNDTVNAGAGSRLKVAAIINSANKKRSVPRTGPKRTIGTNLSGQFGNLRILSNGRFVYKVFKNRDTVKALQDREKLIENFTYVARNNKPGVVRAKLRIRILGVNDAPTISALATVNVAENTTAVTNVNATDPEGETENGGGLVYTLSGDDEALFSITPAGILTFNVAPDFENKQDANTDNDYEVTVTVTDSGSLNDVQAITVTVTDISEGLPNVALGTISALNLGFLITGVDQSDQSGISVSGAGDVNGDGFDDLIIGAVGAAGFTGESYVVFGKTTNTPVDLGNLGSGGFLITGIDTGDNSGYSVSGAGDVNGDGFDDLIIGARYASQTGADKSGESYVVFGKTSSTTVDLGNLGSSGFLITGIDAADWSGWSVSGAGDVNGDGLDDLIIGAPLADNAGESYVIFGKTSSMTVDLGNIGSGGFLITGIDAADLSGFSVSGAGDVNGLDDLIIGARGASLTGAFQAGESYVVFGKTTNTPVDLGNLGSGGFLITGIDQSDQSGTSVSGAGDVNGDGLDDLIIGARGADQTGGNSNEGESYVLFGKTSSTTVDLDNLGYGGFLITGIDIGDQSGSSVSGAGDVNGDGFDDLIIGAPLADQGGESYVLFGQAFGMVPGQIVGTDGNNTLNGTAGVDSILGGRGNDTITSNGGADVLRGGEGDDTFKILDDLFANIAGGNGNDTLLLEGGGKALDLTTIPNTRISGIEVIDITGSGNNSLTLNYFDLLHLSDETNTKTVLGNAGDSVNINLTGRSFTSSVNGNFTEYTDGINTLKVHNDVTQTGVTI